MLRIFRNINSQKNRNLSSRDQSQSVLISKISACDFKVGFMYREIVEVHKPV